MTKSSDAAKPRFLCIGAPKCGTTSLYHYLSQHEDIFLSEKKELHFFAKRFLERAVAGPGDKYALDGCPQNIEEYFKCFESADKGKLVGEISPSYFVHNKCFKDIKSTLGEVQVLIMLRNPIEKAYSQYMHLVREGREKHSFEEALNLEEHRESLGYSDFWLYKRSSLFNDSVSRAISIFGKSNVKVLFQEDLFHNREATLKNVFDFLRVKDVPVEAEAIFNRSGQPRSKLVSRLISPGPASRLAKSILPISLGARVKSYVMSKNTGAKLALKKSTRAYLIDYFKADVRDLEITINSKVPWAEFEL